MVTIPTRPSRTTRSVSVVSSMSVGWCTVDDAKRANPERSIWTNASTPSPLAAPDGAVGELERLHERTPTWTLRNRAGAAPCETCACWPGWPLPQFVSPYMRHSSGPATPSSEAQNAGVAPV